jgi:hypothetical protein
LQRGRQHGAGFHWAAGGLIELGERERRAEGEAARALLVGDGDGGLEGRLGGRRIGRIAAQQDFAAQTMEVRVRDMLPRLRRERQALVNQHQSAVRTTCDHLELGEQSVIPRRTDLVALSQNGRQRSPQLTRAGFWIDQLTIRPVGVNPTKVSVSLDPVLFRYLEQGVRGEARGSDVVAAGFQHCIPKTRLDDGCDVAQFLRAAERPVAKAPRALDLAKIPFRQCEVSRRTYFSVPTEPEPRFSVSFWSVLNQRLLKHGSRRFQAPLEQQDQAKHSASRAGFHCKSTGLGFAQEGLGGLSRQAKFTTDDIGDALRVIGDKPRGSVFGQPGEFASAVEGGLGFVGAEAPPPPERMTIRGLEIEAALALRPQTLLVRHLDRLAELGDRLLEGRAAERLIACLAPPFDRKVVQPRLRQMMRDDFRLRRGALWNIAQNFGRTAVQHLAAALEQAVVGRVLDQRVLEAIVRPRRRPLDEKDIGTGEPLKRRLQRWLVDFGDVAQ